MSVLPPTVAYICPKALGPRMFRRVLPALSSLFSLPLDRQLPPRSALSFDPHSDRSHPVPPAVSCLEGPSSRFDPPGAPAKVRTRSQRCRRVTRVQTSRPHCRPPEDLPRQRNTGERGLFRGGVSCTFRGPNVRPRGVGDPVRLYTHVPTGPLGACGAPRGRSGHRGTLVHRPSASHRPQPRRRLVRPRLADDRLRGAQSASLRLPEPLSPSACPQPIGV